MLIREMTREASLDLLTRKGVGRLACSLNDQPYITPLTFAHGNSALYSFSTAGQKIDWMRANPLVCLAADEIESPQKWMSVIVFGRYEELPETDVYREAREFAHSLLSRQPLWWEPGYARTIIGGKERALEPIYFRIHIHRMSGHQASPE
jgi:uncharacterized protein